MKKCSFILLFASFILIACASMASADAFSISVPAGTEVVMADPQAAIPVTVTNQSLTRNIRSITFNIDTSMYTFSAATRAPSGWCVKSVTSGAINFELVQAGGSCSNGSTLSQLDPGESVVFNITVLPAASASDSVDAFSSVTVSTQSGFTVSGPMPTWTRRSLEASMSATPSSTGVGSAVTLAMQVTNRSTTSKSSIASTPVIPTPSSPIMTNTGGPFYSSALLTSGLSLASTTVNVSSTAEFPSSGTIMIESEELCYTGKTATSFTGAARGCNSTVASTHSSGALAFGMDPFSLSPGETKAVIWTYLADSSGQVYFAGRATDPGGTGRSQAVISNTVVIGNFTASLALAPASVISGQSVTVEMTVTNNGNNALVNVTPSLLAGCAGGATETLVSGPNPAFISSLAKGSSGVFAWTYNITGSVGQAYCLTGGASANGPVLTDTVTTNSGIISNYSVTVVPSTVASGSTNFTITWNLYNGGGCGLRQAAVGLPQPGWNCSSVAAPPGWQGSCGGEAQFSSTGPGQDIPSGSNGSFSVTFSTSETVTGDKTVPFPVSIVPRGCGGAPSTLGSYVTVSAYGMTLTHTPVGPLYADGSSYYTLTATLLSGGAPVSGKTVTFGATTGNLSASAAVTDASGQAVVRLAAPNSSTDVSSTVTAEYLSAQATDTLAFLGWTKANLQYWGSLTPGTVTCGSPYTFTMQLKNISATSGMTIGTGSYLAFNDSASGGSSEFRAYLDSPVTISPGATQNVSFGSPKTSGGGGGVAVTSAFLAGSFEPISNPAPPPSSGLFLTDGGTNDQYRAVTDTITTGGGCGSVRVRILDWHEMR